MSQVPLTNPNAPIIQGAPKSRAPVQRAPELTTTQKVVSNGLTAISYVASISSYLSFEAMGLMGKSLSSVGSYLNPPAAARRPVAPTNGQQPAAAQAAAPTNAVSKLIGSGLQRSGSAISNLAEIGPKYTNGKTAAVVAGAYVASNVMPAAVSSVASVAIRSSAQALLAPIAYAPTLFTSLTGLVFSPGMNSLIGLAVSPLASIPSVVGSVVSMIPAEVIIGGYVGYKAAGFAAEYLTKNGMISK